MISLSPCGRGRVRGFLRRPLTRLALAIARTRHPLPQGERGKSVCRASRALIQISNSQRSAGPILCGAGAPSSLWRRPKCSRARGMPGLNEPTALCAREKSTQAEFTASPPDHPASRARCEWLALRQPRRTDASGKRRPTFYPPLVTHGRWAGSSQLGPPLRGRAFCALPRPPHPAPGLMTLETSLEGDGISGL
jgi:hypothetical protein